MKWLPIFCSLIALLAVAPVRAEKPISAAPAFSGTISPGELTPTPEMWFYEQEMRQYMDPQMMVRRRAETQAAQRENRMAARRWFGYSNARPRASSDPFDSEYATSPRWVSNDPSNPNGWRGQSGAVVLGR